MPDWSIKIIESSSTGTKFDPVEQLASLDDLVTWNNTTGECHQPWMLDAKGNPVPDPRTKIDPNKPFDACDGGDPNDPPNFDPASRLGTTKNYLSDCIAPGGSSRPSFDTTPAGTTINYFCKAHPQRTSERGSIKVT